MPVLQLPHYLASFPLLTRCACILLFVSSFFFLLLRLTVATPDLKFAFRGSNDVTLAFPWLVVVPGNLIWYPWTLVSASWVESGIIEFVISLLSLAFSGRYFEHIWGAKELFKFIMVVTVVSNFVCAALNILQGIVLGNYALYFFGMDYHGMLALQTAFFVAFTQVIPEHQVHLFAGLIKLRIKQVPMLLVGLSNVMCIVGYQSPFFLIQLGWLVSWAYLRFIKWGENGEFRGDRSETFAFSSWFPPFAQPYVSKLSDYVFDIFVKLHILQPWNPADLESGISMPARAEAERRRQMALKALTQKLNVNKPRSPMTQPGHSSMSPPVSATSTVSNSSAPPASPAPPHASLPSHPTHSANEGNVIFDAENDNTAAKEKS